jgi:hypothetical protein
LDLTVSRLVKNVSKLSIIQISKTFRKFQRLSKPFKDLQRLSET